VSATRLWQGSPSLGRRAARRRRRPADSAEPRLGPRLAGRLGTCRRPLAAVPRASRPVAEAARRVEVSSTDRGTGPRSHARRKVNNQALTAPMDTPLPGVELASLPREQVGPFLILGVPKDADAETIEAHWAQRVLWARQGKSRISLEDIHWAR